MTQYESAIIHFPKLGLPRKISEGWEIMGEIDVIDDENSYWDTYGINIIVPNLFPLELFILNETSGKIPNSEDWHNIDSCCVSTDARIYSVLCGELTLLNYIEKFVVPFLANHIVKLRTGSYASGEFEHGVDGKIQDYENFLGVQGANAVYQKLKTICSVVNRGRNSLCFCGSGLKTKHCYEMFPLDHNYIGIPYFILCRDLLEIKCYHRLL